MSDGLFDEPAQILPADWDLPATIRGRLGTTVGRQRTMSASGHLLVIVHRPPEPDEDERRGCIAWRDPSDRWRAVDGRDGLVALRATIDEYDKLLAQLDEALERQPAIDGVFDIQERLAPVARAARHLHAALQAAREACPTDRRIIDLRDRAYATERRAELLGGDARFALDRAMAKNSHVQAQASRRAEQASHRLNRMVALFLPLGTAAAILGMNIKTGLEDLPPPAPLLIILALGALAGLVLVAAIHRDAAD